MRVTRLTRGDWIVLAILVGIPLVAFSVPAALGYPLLTGDSVIQNYPLRVLAGEIIRHGHLPVYDPYAWAGSPLLASSNAGSAFPDIFFFAIFPPLVAWVATEVAAFGAAAVGLYTFLRFSRLGPLCAALGGATDKTSFVPAVGDFYLTNPIARASRVMAECSALRRGVQREAAE